MKVNVKIIFKFILYFLNLKNILSNINNNLKEKYTFIKNLNKYPTNYNTTYGIGECSNLNNCNLPNGICLNATTCMCMPDYADFNIEFNFKDDLILNKNVTLDYTLRKKPNKKFCTYRKKSIIVAGLLELFLPFGLGHFYAGHQSLGCLKLFCNFLIYIFGCILHFKETWESNDTYFDLMVICIILSCLIPIWNILDLFLFFTASYKDGYGIDMS